MANSNAIGQRAESLACDYLQQQGLKLISKNFHSKRGEIDLIFRDDDTLVFVEVRYRKHTQYGSALDSVTTTKQQKIIATAQTFLLQYPDSDYNCRFDVVAISPNASSKQDDINWIKHAFEVN